MENPEDTQINNTDKPADKQISPDERSGIWLESFIRISDPETGEVIVETRT